MPASPRRGIGSFADDQAGRCCDAHQHDRIASLYTVSSLEHRGCLTCASADQELTKRFRFPKSTPMRNDENIHPEAAVAPGYLANHAERVFNRAVEAALRPHGISLALLGPLLWLSWRGPMLQRDLVHASAIKQPAMVAILDKLEAAGFVEREPLPEDRRASTVSITEQGKQIAAVGKQVLLDTNARGVDGFTPEEATALVTLLHRFIGNLE